MTAVEDTSKDRQIILYIPDKTIGRNNKTTKLCCSKNAISYEITWSYLSNVLIIYSFLFRMNAIFKVALSYFGKCHLIIDKSHLS